MIIQEQALGRLLQCPLMTPTSPSGEETCAYALASWALRQSFENKLVGDPAEILSTIRGKMIKLWKESGVADDPGKLARTSAFRLFNLVLDYETVHLEQPYNLVLAGYTIQGKYALLRKRTGECFPHILILHSNSPSLKHDQAVPPDVQTLARYLHVTTASGYTEVQVIHYPVFRGKTWFNKTVDGALARRYLQDMLKVAALRPQYPIAGEHCATCCTKPCLEVFRGQDDNSR